MTYQEYYNILYKEYEEASANFLKLDKELSQTRGFGDFESVPEYLQAKIKWQIATNNYWGFLSSIRGKNINPDDIFVLQ